MPDTTLVRVTPDTDETTVRVGASDTTVAARPNVDSTVVVATASVGPRGLTGTGLPGETGEQGEQGERGLTGPEGPPGPPSVAAFVWDQGDPQTTWHVAHSLGFHPNVTVVDSAGTEVEGIVRYLDANVLEIDFTVPFGGKAFLS